MTFGLCLECLKTCKCQFQSAVRGDTSRDTEINSKQVAMSWSSWISCHTPCRPF